ncbi:energy transducer TonB [Mucilaginibacter terrenus]|uniref:Energy transducer TonB n=1 Tax=Mucilaginibacter terrenus TaxID=2482727 RepID=A0A3E2NPN1_9SPHI|nr:energy transducer TonB [Mucilaginibacter terrenus]RFZ82911.1 energy transducer TonB [Mucilaginibacter terrenus]
MKNIIVIVLLSALSSNVNAQSLNKKLMLQLDSINRADQQYRSKAAQLSARTSREDDKNMQKQARLDAENLAKIDKIIARYGYPGKSLVGEKYMSVAFMVVQHGEPEAREKYLPLMLDAAKKGELRASSVAIMIDRNKVDKGEKQVYGSQLHETPQGIKLQPIEDEANVNVRRAAVGLPPLEQYLKEWNIKYKVPAGGYQNPSDIYYHAPELPSIELIGGYEALYKKLAYPEKAKDNNISGDVVLELTVDKNGNPKDISVVKSLGFGCDEEALNAMKAAKFTNATGEDRDIRVKLPFPYKQK